MNKLRHIISSTLLTAAAITASAANQIPPDPDTRIGTLDNGLTYYIRHNEWPRGQVDFFLAQRVGSINEEENQRGLAHFLEHMCFNGTAHFPGNTLIDYLESIGVKFGRNLNAYTSTDETVYNICEVPSGRTSALDSCVMILSDWSGNLLLRDEDIDAERGVIHGEMRQRSSAGSRILEKIAPDIYQDGIYGSRMPIGLAEVVENFNPETLRAYYHKWYHPGNQAVIVVGDINPDSVEASIRRHFAGFQAAPGAEISHPVDVADNDRPIAVTASDPEQGTWQVQLFVKHDNLPEEEQGTIAEMREDYIRQLIVTMLVERFDGLEQRPGCPWSNLGIGDKKFLLSSTRDALMLRATAHDAIHAREAMREFNTELRRVALHGFTDTELTRAKLTVQSDLDTRLANRDRESNTDLARRYARHFTSGGIIPSTEQLFKMMKGVSRTTTLETVNAYARTLLAPDGRNLIMTAYAPVSDTANLSAEDLLADFAATDGSVIEPFVDTYATRPLLAEKPAPGTITGKEDGPFGTQVLSLSNGIRVYLKHTDFKPDEVRVTGVSPGGFSMNYNPAAKANYKMTDDVLAISGFGGHSSSDFRKLLAGHNVRSAIKIGNMNEELTAVTSPRDLETAFQVLYLKATGANRDDIAFDALMTATRSRLSNPNPTATVAMGDSIHSIVYGRHPLGEKLRAADLANVDYDSIIAIHRDRFADMSDFTFIITGNFPTDSIETLICDYIASLPGGDRKERPRDIGYGFFHGDERRNFTYPMNGESQSIVYSFYNGECPYNLANVLSAQAFGSILKTRLQNELRENRGLTYGVKAHCSVTAGFNGPDTPSRFILPVYIKIAAGHENECFETVRTTLSDLATKGPTDDELLKIKTYLAKSIADNRSDNGYWETVVKIHALYGPDMDSDYETLLETMTPESIRDFAARILPSADRIELAMTPAARLSHLNYKVSLYDNTPTGVAQH